MLTQETETPAKLPKGDSKTCLLVDGPALIQAIGKPEKAKTFGDLGEVFCHSVVERFGDVYSRIDVMFDQHNESSIKSGTRQKRAGSTRPIRRVITSEAVKLPSNWKSFLSLSSNKADLAAFLSRALIEKAKSLSQEYELVVAGGFENILDAWSSFGRPVDGLKSTHEEADTRLILHAEDTYRHGFNRCVLQCRDTDVLVLALGFRDKLSPELWLSTGSSSKHPFIPVHSISLDDTTAKNIIAFHAMTGCDTVSQFAGKGKKTAWKVFQEMPDSLRLLGASTVSPEATLEAERFVCRLYMKTAECTSVNEARQRIFMQGKKSLEALPPTKDALDKHIQRANYQCFVWN